MQVFRLPAAQDALQVPPGPFMLVESDDRCAGCLSQMLNRTFFKTVRPRALKMLVWSPLYVKLSKLSKDRRWRQGLNRHPVQPRRWRIGSLTAGSSS